MPGWRGNSSGKRCGRLTTRPLTGSQLTAIAQHQRYGFSPGQRMADAPPVTRGRSLDEFTAALYDVAAELAKMLVKDGEGATKFITVRVTGAATVEEAETAAPAVANSNLVKTVFFGEDANWGRIPAAAGWSGD